MKLASEKAAGLWLPIPRELEAILGRLEQLSLGPEFSVQREAALRRVLQIYLEMGPQAPLAPLTEEVELADGWLYADFYPEDGQLTLIEQLRDVITEHIPNEERQWLDPLKHSYMDLVEVLAAEPGASRCRLRSIGNGRLYEVPIEGLAGRVQAGKVLLTRLVREPGDPETTASVGAGPALVLTMEDTRALSDAINDERRQMELVGGSFELGDWPEFAKRYGHLLLAMFARMRFIALADAVAHIRYRHESGSPDLYLLALYEHREFSWIAGSLGELEGLTEVAAGGGAADKVRRWVMQEKDDQGNVQLVARVTVTATQLVVECDAQDRLNALKHSLAATFGFSLHYRGETEHPPARRVTQEQLTAEEPLTLVLTNEEDRAFVNAFLEKVYLEWADRESPALGGQTPRHAASVDASRPSVVSLIDQLERNDPGLWRTGASAFDYNKLRAHVGLV
ncbi:MAG: hypothetical protein KF814_07360 [Nitrospiraceae bacterium]|nr:hypothetical protein [Nitrospiraceae bacterium]